MVWWLILARPAAESSTGKPWPPANVYFKMMSSRLIWTSPLMCCLNVTYNCFQLHSVLWWNKQLLHAVHAHPDIGYSFILVISIEHFGSYDEFSCEYRSSGTPLQLCTNVKNNVIRLLHTKVLMMNCELWCNNGIKKQTSSFNTMTLTKKAG